MAGKKRGNRSYSRGDHLMKSSIPWSTLFGLASPSSSLISIGLHELFPTAEAEIKTDLREFSCGMNLNFNRSSLFRAAN